MATVPAETSTRRRVVMRVVVLVVTGVSLYLVAPALLDVLGSWRELESLGPGWLVLMLAAQTLSFAGLWECQRVAMHERRRLPIVVSQLAANAVARVVPGGGATAAAVQYRMLVAAGVRPGAVAAGLGVTNVIIFATLTALPALALPAWIGGAPIADGLQKAAIAGLLLFVAVCGAGTAALIWERPLVLVGRAIEAVRARLLDRYRDTPRGVLPRRLLAERDRVLRVLGRGWHIAVPAAAARWLFDYATLVIALAAVDSHPRASLVLLAFFTAQLLGQIPLTPGGLGFVEAGLTATLALAGVTAGAAVAATFAYRLFSYWLPLPAGAAAALVHRRRYLRA
jgi:uncharacterized membrane protein YbhN (UPF0104 family)